MATIEVARTDEQILATWPVMSQLRPHIGRDEYVGVVRRLERDGGYTVVSLSDGGRVVAAGGYRFGESLAWGHYLYVDDLVSDEALRSHGHGRDLFAWMVEQAREAGCKAVHLDSGVQRHGAHRFYLRERMDIVFYHFRLDL